jgi:hypothetical protein
LHFVSVEPTKFGPSAKVPFEKSQPVSVDPAKSEPSAKMPFEKSQDVIADPATFPDSWAPRNEHFVSSMPLMSAPRRSARSKLQPSSFIMRMFSPFRSTPAKLRHPMAYLS